MCDDEKQTVWLGVWSRTWPTLLILAIVAAVAGGITYWPQFSGRANKAGLVLQAAYRAWKWDRAYDSIPPEKIFDEDTEIYSESSPMMIWGIQTNSYALVKWVIEILPYFTREGIADEVTVPDAAIYMPDTSDRYHFNIAGLARCGGYFLLNWRYHNDVSPWYDRTELATIVHELGHVQGVCVYSLFATQEQTSLMEASNQVATVEVLAAMANDGNEYATRALLDELRGWAMSYVRVEAYENEVGWLYEFYANRLIYNSPEERSRHARSLRFWADKNDDLMYIIRSYSVRPYQWAMLGVEAPNNKTMRLFGEGGQLDGRQIVMDDLKYFMSHVRGFTKAARQAARNSGS